jgi:hypothetical protein
MDSEEPPSLLLALPDPCLMAVLEYCADDQRTLCSAARAHSRLHQAAVLALRSITARLRTGSKRMDSVMLYMGKHAQRADSFRLLDGCLTFGQMPPDLQLSSLEIGDVPLQLRPRNGCRGMQGAFAIPQLKQLRLDGCTVLDNAGPAALAAALLQLPSGLEHLSIDCVEFVGHCTAISDVCYVDDPGHGPDGIDGDGAAVSGSVDDDSGSSDYASDSGGYDGDSSDDETESPVDTLPYFTSALPHLQQLTFLELSVLGAGYYSTVARSPALQPLQDMTQLVDLRLWCDTAGVAASMLSGTHGLTRLELRECTIDPDILAGKTKLQHLSITHCNMVRAADSAQLLSHLQHMEQLTRLSLQCNSWLGEGASPPAAACAALTASSKLQKLAISKFGLPADAWRHIFPAGRQLPLLRSLDISDAVQPVGGRAPGLEGSRLVSCCPDLQSLDMIGLHYTSGLLTSLQELTGLHKLKLNHYGWIEGGLQPVCQLEGLKKLHLDLTQTKEPGVLRQLTALKQLTYLRSSIDDASLDERYGLWVSKVRCCWALRCLLCLHGSRLIQPAD